WTFGEPGTFEFACLLPGHYEAGMHGPLTVN
ncbi:plastocyanin/azurin family copper-binding protein, partial [Salipiger sp. PrR002]